MPKIIKVGPTTEFIGKTLWEILGNLKNFGVGRLVRKNIYDRYPEASYFRILKVETLSPPKNPNNERKVRAYTEKVFRGRRFEKVFEISHASSDPDYALVPKSEEKALIEKANVAPYIQRKTIPKTISFPPLLKELIIQDRLSKGLTTDEEPRMKVVIRNEEDQLYSLAGDEDKPTIEYNGGIGTPATPQLYEIPPLFKEKLKLT